MEDQHYKPLIHVVHQYLVEEHQWQSEHERLQYEIPNK